MLEVKQLRSQTTMSQSIKLVKKLLAVDVAKHCLLVVELVQLLQALLN